MSNTTVTSKTLTKADFETFYEDVIGEPISLTEELWAKVAEDIMEAIEEAIEEQASNISRNIYEENY